MGCLAARVGDERTAFEYFFSGIKNHPLFIPALEGLLNLRVAGRLVEARRWELLHVARVEPQFAQKIFDYLLLHRAFEAARHLVRTISLNESIGTAGALAGNHMRQHFAPPRITRMYLDRIDSLTKH